MNYQSSWIEKAKKLPQEILARLDIGALGTPQGNSLAKHPHFIAKPYKDGQSIHRALIFGEGTEFFITTLNNFIDQSRWKIFIGTHSSSQPLDKPQDNLIYLKGQSTTYLSSFPPGTFDLIISLWSFQPSHNTDHTPKQLGGVGTVARRGDFISLLTNIHSLLKKSGKFSIVIYLDGSPELPLNILKKIIKQHKSWSLKIFKSTLPASAGEFRRMLNKARLGDVRIWKDSIVCEYLNAEDIYNDIFVTETGLFSDAVPPEYITIIKEEFIQELKAFSFPIKIVYDFVGASGATCK